MSSVSSDAPVLIDQEGGRVQRLGPPHWPVYPPGAVFGALYDHRPRRWACRAARLSARLIAADLLDLGITVDCLPLADVPVAGADAVIGNRAYGTEPGKVAAIARAVTEGLEQGGVLPVLKHIPGHGRATADSHYGCRWSIRRRDELEADRFRRIPAAGGPADGDDRTCCVQRARSRPTGDDFCDNHRAGDSRRDRVPGFVDE